MAKNVEILETPKKKCFSAVLGDVFYTPGVNPEYYILYASDTNSINLVNLKSGKRRWFKGVKVGSINNITEHEFMCLKASSIDLIKVTEGNSVILSF